MRRDIRSTRHGRKDHGYCCWCKRALLPSNIDSDLAFTEDHVHAVTRRSGRWVPACRKCNFLKADLPIDEWLWFIDHMPRYWRAFSNPVQVARICVAERVRRARAGEPPLTRELQGSHWAPISRFNGMKEGRSLG